MSARDRSDYNAVTKALKDRFDPERDTGVYWAQLRGRTRKKGESLSDLAGSIQRMAARAYPGADVLTRGTMEVQHFIDAIDNREIQRQIRRNKPRTLGEAVRMALDEESFETLDGASKPKPPVGVGSLLEKGTDEAEPTETQLAQLVKRLSELEAQLGRNKASGGTPPLPRPNPFYGQAARGPQCFRCSEWGHMQANCPLN